MKDEYLDGYGDIFLPDVKVEIVNEQHEDYEFCQEADKIIRDVFRQETDKKTNNMKVKETSSSKRTIKNCLGYSGMSMSWNLNMFSGPKFSIQCWDCKCWF